MKKTRKTKWLHLLCAVVMVLSVTAAASAPASASGVTSPASQITVTKNPSYNKDGFHFTSFTMKNTSNTYTATHSAKVFNSAGKEMCSWQTKQLAPGKTTTRDFGAPFKDLPYGTYTFKLYRTLNGNTLTTSYTINHDKSRSISFISYETYYDANGRYMHKFNIQFNGMKGKAGTVRIYNSNGNLITSWTGNIRQTENELGSFSWSGHKDGVKYPSGNYTIVITCDGKTIEKTYKLNILEVVKG